MMTNLLLLKCMDCGNKPWDAGEDFYVHNHLWYAAIPPSKRHRVICIACFETRLKRPLTPQDFKPWFRQNKRYDQLGPLNDTPSATLINRLQLPTKYMNTNPITPNEALKKAHAQTPTYVYEAFNELIVKNLDTGTGQAIIPLDAVKQLIANKGGLLEDGIRPGWLNIETAYRQAGWKVSYTSPDMSESFAPFYQFSAKGA